MDEQPPQPQDDNLIAMLGTVIKRQEEIEEAQRKIMGKLERIEAMLGIS